MPIETTKLWVQNFVLKHNLCPFAHRPHQQGTIRYHLCTSDDLLNIIQDFLSELDLLQGNRAQTTLIIYPSQLSSFDEYLDVVTLMEDVLLEHDLHETYQIASFHPKYL